MTMDEQTYRAFVLANRDRVYSYAWYFLRHREDAEDVIQEAFLRLWRQCRADDDAGRRAWLTRVVHNLCVDADRRRRVRHHRVRLAAEGELERHVDQRAGAGEELEAAQAGERRQMAVAEALAQLPAPSRGLVLLHYWQGVSLREIARMFDLNESTVKVRVHRARQALRQGLAGQQAAEVSP
jgi:RNA polymerase sigma-70 factor (ECF subfamily)